jgi:tetratricopeptide (TPR) repeat protein/DNA-binding CsgD family transcriptional regulator
MLVVSLLLQIKVNAQDQVYIDSVKSTLSIEDDSLVLQSCKELYRAFYRINLDSSGYYARYAHNRSLKSSDPRVQADGNNLIATYFYHTSKLDSALYYYQAAQAKFKEANDLTWELNLSSNIALIYESMGDVDKALNEHLTSLAKKEDAGLEGEFIASSYWNIAIVLGQLEKLDEAYGYYEKALEVYNELGIEQDIMDVEFQMGGILVKKGSLDEAEQLFLKNAEYSKENNQKVSLAEVYDRLGDIYNQKKEYTKSEPLLLEGLQIANESNYKALPGQLCRRLTDLYLATNQMKKAEKFALLSMENAKEVGRGKKIITDYYNLSTIYERQGNDKLALSYYKMYATQQDSIFGIDKLNAINSIQLKYEKATKAQEIELLKEKEKRAKQERNSLLIGIVGLFILFGLILYAVSQRMKRNRIAKEKLNQELEFNKKELEFKQQELIAYTLQLAQKNKVLNTIKTDIQELKGKTDNGKDVQKLVNTITRNQGDNENWEEFRRRFLSVHKDFEVNVMKSYPAVTSNELRLMALLKMNLSNNEIAFILNISGDGIKKARYRLRKKLGLITGDSLEALVLSM